MLKEKNAVTIMDAACGTGVDSVMLIEEMGNNPGFHLTSCDFSDMLKPGGILIIDHRNYDYILKHGKSPNKNIYYNSSIYKVVTKTIYEDGKAKQIILDYRKKGEEDGNFLLHV